MTDRGKSFSNNQGRDLTKRSRLNNVSQEEILLLEIKMERITNGKEEKSNNKDLISEKKLNTLN